MITIDIYFFIEASLTILLSFYLFYYIFKRSSQPPYEIHSENLLPDSSILENLPFRGIPTFISDLYVDNSGTIAVENSISDGED